MGNRLHNFAPECTAVHALVATMMSGQGDSADLAEAGGTFLPWRCPPAALPCRLVEKYKNAIVGETSNRRNDRELGGRYKGDDPSWRAKTTEGETTLADIKRRQREE